MLVLPQVGMARSVAPEHNVELDALCDWIEASLAFTKLDFISDSDIVDVLTEEEIYESQEFAWELVDNAFAELRRRRECLSAGSPFEIKGDRIVRTKDLENVPAYAFCLTLACAKWYPKWALCLVKPERSARTIQNKGNSLSRLLCWLSKNYCLVGKCCELDGHQITQRKLSRSLRMCLCS